MAGLTTDLGAAIDFARALALVDLGDREQVRAAGAAVFVRRRDDLEIYDEVFARFWRARGTRLPEGPESGAPGEPAEAEDEDDGVMDPTGGDEREGSEARPDGVPTGVGEDSDDPDAEIDEDGPVVISERAYSASEADRHRQFDRMTAAELRDAERLIDLLVPNLERRRTRRSELHRHGRVVAPRAMFRRSLSTGGDVLEWVWRRPVRRPRAARRHLRHLGLDGAPRPDPPPVQPGPGRLGRPDRGVRVRHEAHPGDPAPARPGP